MSASAQAPRSFEQWLPARARTVVDARMGWAARAREASRSSYAEAVTLGAAPVARAPAFASLDEAVAGLLRGVDVATAALRTISDAEIERASRDPLSLTHVTSRADAPALVPTLTAMRPTNALRTLGIALDRAMPALVRASRAGSSLSASGCDLIDRLPTLCIGSEADNVYEENAELLIDLGGADVYHNSAGGAPAQDKDGGWLRASVNIDLAGDDVYEGTGVVQGGGFLGGAGIAIDVAGDDRYIAHVPDGSVSVAQGGGFASGGALFDLGGNDSYAVEGWNGTADFGMAVAQGGADFCGVTVAAPEGAGCALGLLSDGGTGNDSYSVSLGTVSGGGERHGYVQGAGSFGVGVLIDDGGDDDFLTTASAALTGIDAYPDGGAACPGTSPIPTVCLNAQGAAIAGIGLLLEGAGDTTYAVDVRSEGMVWDPVHAQGAGLAQGIGILDDAAGNDIYRTAVNVRTVRALSAGVGCVGPCRTVVVDATWGAVNEVVAQGAGVQVGAIGILRDGKGNDTYVAEASASLVTTLVAEGDEPATLTTTGYTGSSLRAQGSGDTSIGVLVDLAGTDAYELRSINSADARAHGSAARATALTAALQGLQGQGAASGVQPAMGALIDLAGSGDRVRATAANPASAYPDASGARQRAREWPHVQGAFGGVLVALGDAPSILSSPSRPVCAASSGRRGFGHWLECAVSSGDPETQVNGDLPIWMHANGGFAPQAIGTAPTLIVTGAPARFQHGVAVPIEARLTDASGTPIEGAPLHLELQTGCALLCAGALEPALGTYWYGEWSADAVTDASGVARATLPGNVAPNRLVRAHATFDGAMGAYPAHAERRIPTS